MRGLLSTKVLKKSTKFQGTTTTILHPILNLILFKHINNQTNIANRGLFMYKVVRPYIRQRKHDTCFFKRRICLSVCVTKLLVLNYWFYY